MAADKRTYAEKLKDPRWQKKRLEVLNRDGFACQYCFDDSSTLHVHHLAYHGEPWDAPLDHLLTLCERCHEDETSSSKTTENELCQALRIQKFSAWDVRDLARAFSIMDDFHVPDVMCSVLVWALTTDDITTELCDRYFAQLGEANRIKFGLPPEDKKEESPY